MSMNDSIEEVVALLEGVSSNSPETPAMIFLPPDSGDFIIGNQGGFVRLAIASLKAAQGERQLFKNKPWISDDDLDWSSRGLKYDEHAPLHLPAKRTLFQKILRSILGFSLMGIFLVCFVVGLITTFHWFFR